MVIYANTYEIFIPAIEDYYIDFRLFYSGRPEKLIMYLGAYEKDIQKILYERIEVPPKIQNFIVNRSNKEFVETWVKSQVDKIRENKNG